MVWLLYADESMMIQYRNVTDGQTDRQTDSILHWRAIKIWCDSSNSEAPAILVELSCIFSFTRQVAAQYTNACWATKRINFILRS